MRFSTQRWLPGFCELRRSSPDNSQCTPHSVGDRQVLPAPIRKTPAFPPTGLRPVGRQKATFSSTGRDAFSFSRKRGPPPQPSEAVAVGKRKAAKRRQRRKKRAGFEEAARLADPKGPGIAMPRRCARGQRSGMRDALPRRASRIWRSLTRRRMGAHPAGNRHPPVPTEKGKSPARDLVKPSAFADFPRAPKGRTPSPRRGEPPQKDPAPG